MPAHSKTDLFYGLLVTATSLLIAAHAFEQINDPQLRLALQRKGLDAHLRRLVLEELVPSVFKLVEKELVENSRCRGCLRAEEAKRSAMTLAHCLLRRGLPLEVRQTVMNLVVDGDIGGPISLFDERRTLRELERFRTNNSPGGAADDSDSERNLRLRWTDLFLQHESGLEPPAEWCQICQTEEWSSSFEYLYSPERQEVVNTFLSGFSLRLFSTTLNGPRPYEFEPSELLYLTHDVLAAVQVTPILLAHEFPRMKDSDMQNISSLQFDPSFLATHQPTIPLTTFHRLALFGVRSTDLIVPQVMSEHHLEAGTIEEAYAGSKLKEAAWTIWSEFVSI